MKKILDQASDLNGQQTYRLTTLYSLPEYVKQASSSDLYGYDYMSQQHYADSVNRVYPIHTKQATIMSAAFFYDNKAQHSNIDANTIEANIIKAAARHNITKDLNNLRTQVKEAQADPYYQLTDDQFALVLNTNGKSERYYPIRNNSEVKTAAAYLQKHTSLIPLAYRLEMSRRILTKAAEYAAELNLETNESLNKQAGYGTCAAADAARLLKSRALELKADRKLPDVQREFEKMAKMCIDNPTQVKSTSSLRKLAQIIDTVDRTCGYHYKCETGELERPEEVLFNITEKVASDVESQHCSMVTGSIYKIADFNRLSLDDIRDVMGDDFADEVSSGKLIISPEKFADIATTLPRNDAELIDRLLSQTGIKAVAKTASAEQPRFASNDLFKLAALKM